MGWGYNKLGLWLPKFVNWLSAVSPCRNARSITGFNINQFIVELLISNILLLQDNHTQPIYLNLKPNLNIT